MGFSNLQVNNTIADAINDSTTAIGPSQNAVFDALALKAPVNSPTFTGAVGGVTKAMVGLTNVDDTSDATKNAAAVTLTNKRITKRVASTANDATSIIDCDTTDDYYLTAMSAATEISVTGTPTNGQEIFIALKDDGTTRGLTWTGITALGVTLPATTTVSKQHIIKIKYITSAWFAIAASVAA